MAASTVSHNSAASKVSARSLASQISLPACIVSGGNLENISLSPSRNTEERSGSPHGGSIADSRHFDFNLSQEEFDELIGSSQSMVSGDASIQRLPPLKKAFSRVDQEILLRPEPVQRKKQTTTITGYKPVAVRECSAMQSVSEPQPKFKYQSKTLSKPPQPGLSRSIDSLKLQQPSLAHSLSKVSVHLTDSLDASSAADSGRADDSRQSIPPPKYTGKFLSRAGGVVTVQERKASMHNTRSTSSSNLFAQSTIEYVPSHSGSKLPGRGAESSPTRSVEEGVSSAAARPSSRASNAPALHATRDGDRLKQSAASSHGRPGSRPEERIAIPTGRVQSPPATSSSHRAGGEAEADYDPGESSILGLSTIMGSEVAGEQRLDMHSRQRLASPARLRIPQTSSSPDRPASRALTRTTSKFTLHSRSAHSPSSRSKAGKSPQRVAYVLSSADRAAEQNQRRHEKLQPILHTLAAPTESGRVSTGKGERPASGADGRADSPPTEASMEPASSEVPYLAHKKILGWKLTSVKKRKELIELLDLLSQTQSASVSENLRNRMDSTTKDRLGSPPVGRRRQMLLAQLESAMQKEVEATQAVYQHVPSPTAQLSPPRDIQDELEDEAWQQQMMARDKVQFERVYYRQSVAYENFLERSLQCRLSYKNKVGIAHLMDEQASMKKLVQTTTERDSIQSLASRRTPDEKARRDKASNAFSLQPTIENPEECDENAMDSLRILQLTLEKFSDPPVSSDFDRPMSRLLNSRSALHSQGKVRASNQHAPTQTQVLYDFPYNIHRPLDRMDIIKSVQTRQQLQPLLKATPPTLEETRQLFSRETKMLIAATSGQHVKPTSTSSASDNLLQNYLDSENELLRMLSRDQPDAHAASELGTLLDYMPSDGSSLIEDDQLVDKFIEGRYMAARMKRKLKTQPDNARMDFHPGKASRMDDDEFSVSNMSVSSLGDQSAALYDLLLPSSAAPPPQYSGPHGDASALLLNSSEKASSQKELRLTDSEGGPDCFEGSAADGGQRGIPVTPW